jgi:hypothetical protein
MIEDTEILAQEYQLQTCHRIRLASKYQTTDTGRIQNPEPFGDEGADTNFHYLEASQLNQSFDQP